MESLPAAEVGTLSDEGFSTRGGVLSTLQPVSSLGLAGGMPSEDASYPYLRCLAGAATYTQVHSETGKYSGQQESEDDYMDDDRDSEYTPSESESSIETEYESSDDECNFFRHREALCDIQQQVYSPHVQQQIYHNIVVDSTDSNVDALSTSQAEHLALAQTKNLHHEATATTATNAHIHDTLATPRDDDPSADPTGVTKAKKKKPPRPCPFCESQMPRLQRHLRTVHKAEDAVKRACQLPPKERNMAFKQIRRQAIMKFNQAQMRLENPQLQRERRRKFSSADLVMCNYCNGFFARKHFWRHKEGCKGDSAAVPIAVPVELLKKTDVAVSDEFRDNILSKFIGDDVGKLCMSDATIVLVGSRLYDKMKAKKDKVKEVRNSVRMDMRRIGRLYMHFRELLEQEGTPLTSADDSSSMLCRAHYSTLEEAVRKCTTNPDVTDESESLKAGLKNALYYLLKNMARIVRATRLVKGEDDKANEINKFTEVLALNKNITFGDAVYKTNQRRHKKLRRPDNLPRESDVRLLRDYTLKRIAEIADNEYTVYSRTEFAELRDLTVSRLTLFNARRGGEPARLAVKEWEEADCGAWLTAGAVENCDDKFERQLFQNFKLAYQSGKGNNHLVPILFPPDTISAMKRLTDPVIRSSAEINERNLYVFASTKQSLDHVTGWHAVNRISKAAGVNCPELLNATTMRHLISTLYAAIDVPERDRQLFYKHMGHSDAVNSNVYQAPLAHQEITHVGRHLCEIDNGELNVVHVNIQPLMAVILRLRLHNH